MNSYLSSTELANALALRDPSDPEQGPYALQQLLHDILDAVSRLSQLPAQPVRVSPIVAVEDNYDRLGFAPHAVTPGPALLPLPQPDGDAAQPPHQLDLWRIASRPDLTGQQLDQLVSAIVEAVIPAGR